MEQMSIFEMTDPFKKYKGFANAEVDYAISRQRPKEGFTR